MRYYASTRMTEIKVIDNTNIKADIENPEPLGEAQIGATTTGKQCLVY